MEKPDVLYERNTAEGGLLQLNIYMYLLYLFYSI